MNAFQSRSGGCCCGFLTLNNFGEGSEVLVQPPRVRRLWICATERNPTLLTN